MQSGNYKKDLLIVVPYRDRPDHLKEFLKNSPSYFDKQGLSYDILLCELDAAGDWNAGLCVNALIDFVKDDKEYTWLYVHHVDVWPMHGNWQLPEDNTVLHNLGDYGSCFLKLQHFLNVNGYCNSFWGWGGEDNELYDKLRGHGFAVVDVGQSWPVKFDTEFQNHERKFNGNNYGGGINNLLVKQTSDRDNIQQFHDHAQVKKLPNIAENIFHQLVTPLKKSPREFKNENVLLGYINGIKDFAYVAPFVKSALIYAPYNYDIVMIVSDAQDNVSEYLMDQLTSFGVTVVRDAKTNNNLFIDRFEKYAKFLQSSHYKQCLHVDVTDSYFQSNPFLHVGDSLCITSEGVSIDKEVWNTKMFDLLYGNCTTGKIKHCEVLCGGIIGGSVKKFVNFCHNVVQEYENKGWNCENGVDQIIIQKLIYVDNLHADIVVKRPKDDFCINLHVYKNCKDLVNYCIDIQNNKVVFSENSVKFSIVHQYNRFNELYNGVVNHFVNYFTPV